MFFAELRQREYTKVPRWSQLIVCTRVLGGFAILIRVWVDLALFQHRDTKFLGGVGAQHKQTRLFGMYLGEGGGHLIPPAPWSFPV